MKIRNGFVTNSSSSSFVLAFKDKEDGIMKITKELLDYDSEILGRVLKDFIEATPITVENCDSDNSFYWNFWNEAQNEVEKTDYVKEWRKNNQYKKPWEIYKDATYKDMVQKLTKEKAEKYIEKFSDNPYIVELEYEDHDEIGCELEHNILPYCKFVYKVFNNH